MDTKKGCHSGGCQRYLVCSRECKSVDDYTKCKDFKECNTYLDKYNNSLSVWEDMHGVDYE